MNNFCDIKYLILNNESKAMINNLKFNLMTNDLNNKVLLNTIQNNNSGRSKIISKIRQTKFRGSKFTVFY